MSPEIRDGIPRGTSHRGMGRFLGFVLVGNDIFNPNFTVEYPDFDQKFEKDHPDFGQKLRAYILNRLRGRGTVFPPISWDRGEDPERYIIDLVELEKDNPRFVSAIKQASADVASSWDTSTEKDVDFASSIICLIGRIDAPGAANALHGFSQDKNLETLVLEGESMANQALRFLTSYQHLKPFSNIDFWKKFVVDKDPLRYDAGFYGVTLLDPAEALKLIPVYLENAFTDDNSRAPMINHRLRRVFSTLTDNSDKDTLIPNVEKIIAGFNNSHPEKAGLLLERFRVDKRLQLNPTDKVE